MPGYLEDLNRARMAILSDRAGIDPPQIAQIGRDRAETGPVSLWAGEGLKSPPRAAGGVVWTVWEMPVLAERP